MSLFAIMEHPSLSQSSSTFATSLIWADCQLVCNFADDVVVDPGMEGLGIIDCDEVADILNTLKDNRSAAARAEQPEGLLCDADPDEWMEAYDDLCHIYEEALRQKKGLLLTF